MRKGEVQQLRDRISWLEFEIIKKDIKLDGKEQSISLLYNLLSNKGEKE